MKRKDFIIPALIIGLIIGILLASCMPDPPRPDPSETSNSIASEEQPREPEAQSRSSDPEQSSEVSAAEGTRSSEAQEDRGSSLPEQGDVSGEAKPSGGDIVLWETDRALPDKADYTMYGVAGAQEFSTKDSQVIAELVRALCSVRVTGESGSGADDATQIIVLTYDDNAKSYTIQFEAGLLVYEGKNYSVTGYDDVAAVLSKIAADSEGSHTDDRFIEVMQQVDCRLSDLYEKDVYRTGDTAKKRELAVAVLQQLEGEGLIKKGSIQIDDDTISFMYNNCEEGVLGGIRLKDFDPMMN